MNLKSKAKLNLSLEIGKKLENGYHEIRSVMHQIDLYDELCFKKLEEDKIIVKCNLKELENNQNIVYKTAELIKKNYDIKEGIQIEINKKIPLGAGLAGGSGNAAVTIKAMNELFNLNLDENELVKIGKEIGSDVPFQILGGTVLVEGTGEQLTKLNDVNLNIVLINPGVNISTKWAYDEFDKINKKEQNSFNNLINGIKESNVQEITNNLFNDFEGIIFNKFPEIKKIKEKLKEKGAVNSLMSGSGSSVYGVFTDKEKADKAYNDLRQYYQFVNLIKSKRNIRIAEYAGFCFGVKRALEEIHKLNNNKKIFVLGKLIHSPQVVDELEEKGIKSIEKTDNLDKDSIVVITAHGIPDKKIKELKEKNYEVIDLTCPLVKKVHDLTKQAEKEGYKIIILGDENHLEVKGIKGNLKEPIVISEEIPKLDKHQKYCFVSQTTQNIEKFNKLADELKKDIKDLKVYDTICLPTKQRQQSSIELAKKSDIIIVIGGKISANTKKLAQRCSEITETYHIETEKELKKEWFKNKKDIGITAGASTPDYIIKEVIEKIKNEF